MREDVKEYYGKILQGSKDLKTDACCTVADIPKHIKAALCEIHDEVMTRYYGCGIVVPQKLEGARVLDLGCGAGRDCYVLSKLVGENGYVVGVDMTDEQLDVANKYIDYHTKEFGFSKPNVEFKKGYIEKLDELGLEEGSFDVIVSNCVINLSPYKDQVLEGAYKLLKPGGEIYFSDVYADRRVPKHLLEDQVLYGECLSGALYWNDFVQLAKRTGFLDPRLVTDRPIAIDNEEIQHLIGYIKFFSATYRLFKLEGLEPNCEDYGQAVIYKGTVKHSEKSLVLDKHHTFEEGKVAPVCDNTFRMLKETRLSEHFEFIGNTDVHFGIYSDCGTGLPFDTPEDGATGGCC